MVNIRRIQFMIKRVGSPTGNCYARVYTSTGIIGSTAIPNTQVDQSANIDVTTISNTDYVPIEFVLDAPLTITPGTVYGVTVGFPGGDGSNRIQLAAMGNVFAGNQVRLNIDTWIPHANDIWVQLSNDDGDFIVKNIGATDDYAQVYLYGYDERGEMFTAPYAAEAGASIIDALGKIEYVIEGVVGAATDGTFPTNPAMSWIGEVTKARLISSKIVEDIRGLKGVGATNKMAIVGSVELGRDLVLELEYSPQNWTFARYAASVIGSITPTDAMSSISFGIVGQDSAGDETFAKVSGGVIESLDVEISTDKKAKVTMRIPVKHIYLTTNDPWAADYKGSGTHATPVTSAPLNWDNITSISWGSAIQCKSLKWGVRNNIEKIKDPASAFSTKTKSLQPTKRDFTFSARLIRTAQNAYAVAHNAYTATNLVIAISGTTITFAGAKLAKETIEFMDTGGLSEFDADFQGITSMTYSV